MFELSASWWELPARVAIIYVVLLVLVRLSGKVHAPPECTAAESEAKKEAALIYMRDILKRDTRPVGSVRFEQLFHLLAEASQRNTHASELIGTTKSPAGTTGA
jgi:hypothetical protein